jgi:site-specific recombinase XerD
VRASAVRALLRFAWLEGLTVVPLAEFVGSFAAPAGPAVPKGLSPAQAAEFLAFVRAAPGGLRNEPMMALLLRLALRAGEAARLLLDDIAWRQGVITVRGKGNRADQVPLPADAGGPLARYLRDGRPAGTASRQVFLALDAPHAPLAQAAVTSVAGRALRDAGISGEGAAHLLRHTAACGVLAAGGGLAEAGQLLRHAGPEVTAVYARSDITALRSIARPWPEGEPR